MSAMPVMLAVLCAMAIAYRYYSAFLAAKVAALDDSRTTPAVQFNDGQNYHPTSKWVLFGHHFAAISGAGPLIGPVLAAQFGYLPGLLWIVIGVCLGGAVQDFLILAASLRRGGKSLAQIAYADISKTAGTAATAAILFIVIIALAGLGKVVVKALGGEEVKYPAGSRIEFPVDRPNFIKDYDAKRDAIAQVVPSGSTLVWPGGSMRINEEFVMRSLSSEPNGIPVSNGVAVLPKDAVRLVPGSSWGTFTIAATIPIALLVGLWMYKLRPGKTVEASIIGAVLTLAATFAGGWIAQHPVGAYFNLTDKQVIAAMAIYGFVASVLPVWILLAPRDYLSSFLKIGTIALLVGGTLIANPKLEAPALNHIFLSGGPVVPGKIFPFLFITIMCGAISGFHALVSSGTTPKMVTREGHARTIGYGAMLIEGLVGVVAMIAAATLPVGDFYAMNTDLARVPVFHDQFARIGANVDHLNVYEGLTQESLRGRTGGAVTLAVGMAHIFDGAAKRFAPGAEAAMQTMWKYWYHFAIMFEALFILTTIDAGTRIGRFLLQEVMGKLHPSLGIKGHWSAGILATAVVVAGWTYFIVGNSFYAIWPMFGVANQILAVIALAVASAYLANSGKSRYLAVTLLPMAVVMTTTSSAAVPMYLGQQTTFLTQLHSPHPDAGILFNSALQGSLILAMLAAAIIIMAAAFWRILNTPAGTAPATPADTTLPDATPAAV